jgi:hypothetical protein
LYRAATAARKFLLVAAVLLSSVAHAERHDVLAAAAGFDAQAVPEAGGYGFVYLRHDRLGLLPRHAHLVIEYATDALRLSIERARFDRVELSATLFGEALLAWSLIDFYRDGHDDRSRGFFASHAGASVSAKVDLGPHFIELVLTARRWFFNRTPLTDAALVLPAEPWVGEARLRYTYWHLYGDRSLWEPHRLWWRVRGVAFGVELSSDVRSEVHPWGARDPAVFVPSDRTNDPSKVILGAHQWLRAGVQVHDRVRLQLREEAHWLWGADDLSRVRIGGLNPYAIPLAGAPWGGYVADRVIAAEGSIHVRVKGEHEVGLLVDAVLMADVRRVGDDEVHVLAAIGAFADLRTKKLQIDLRAGWSPTLQPGRALGGFGLAFGIGWGR